MRTQLDGSMQDSQLKSQAITALSSYASTLSAANSALANCRTDRERETLCRKVLELERLGTWLKIERWHTTANKRQLECADEFFSGKHSIVAMVGANRSGKTFAAGMMCFARHLRDYAKKGEIYWCVAPSQERSVSVQQKTLWECLPREMFGDAAFDEKNGFGSQRPTVILEPRGRRIVIRFKSTAQYDSDPRAFESENVSGIWADESIEHHHYESMQLRIVSSGGFMLISTIPDLPWMYEVLEEASPDARIKFIKLAIMDNEENLPPGAIEELEARLSKEEAQMRIYGNFRFLEGLIYTEFIKEYRPDGHLIAPFKVPGDWPKYRAMDVGMDHPTVCLWATVSPSNNLYIYREYWSRNTAISKDAEEIIERGGSEEYEGPVIVDPSAYNITKANPRSVALQYRDAGVEMRQARRATRKHGEWAMIQDVKEWLESRDSLDRPKFYIFDTCKLLISEFRKWRYKRDTHNQPFGSEAFEDKNNDALDALKYLVTANPKWEQQQIQVMDGPRF